MQPVRISAWIGLIIDSVIVLLMLFTIRYGDFSTVPEQTRLALEELAASTGVYTAYVSLIALQILSLWFIARKRAIGLFLAVTTGIFLLPFSMVYLLGCFASYYTSKYQTFSPAPENDEGALRVFLPASPKVLWTFAAVSACLTLVFLSSGGINPASVFMFSFTLAFIYLGYQSGATPALALFNDFFTLRPQLLAQGISIPYTNVLSATLLPNMSLRLDIQTPSGMRLPLHWQLVSVIPEQRIEALEAFGRLLKEHGVPLR